MQLGAPHVSALMAGDIAMVAPGEDEAAYLAADPTAGEGITLEGPANETRGEKQYIAAFTNRELAEHVLMSCPCARAKCRSENSVLGMKGMIALIAARPLENQAHRNRYPAHGELAPPLWRGLMAVEMRRPTNSRYRVERQFRRAVWNGRINGWLLLVSAFVCLILGTASAAAGSIKDLVGFWFIAAMFGAGGLRLVKFKRRPNWLEVAVLREQQERDRDRDDR